jgi:hypothetical protein
MNHVVVRNDIASAVANLTALERSLRDDGDEVSEDVREEIENFIIHVNDEARRLQGLLGLAKDKVDDVMDDVMDDEPEKAPRKSLRKKKKKRGRSPKSRNVAVVHQSAQQAKQKASNPLSPVLDNKKKRKQKDRSEAKKKPSFALFSLVKTPNGAVMLYDPEKVRTRGRNAELVTVPVAKKNNITVKKTELEGLSFEEDLSVEQQNSVMQRLCTEVIAIAQANLSSLTHDAIGAQVLSLLGDGINGDPLQIAQSASTLYGHGDLLQRLAQHSAILAGFREHERLAGEEDGGGGGGGGGGGVTKVNYRAALQTVADSFHVDYGVESLRRYLCVGKLFAQCPVLMLCGVLTPLKTQHLIFGKMLDCPELKERLDNVLIDAQRKMFPLEEALRKGPLIELVDSSDGQKDTPAKKKKNVPKPKSLSCSHQTLECFECSIGFCPTCDDGYGEHVVAFNPHSMEYSYPPHVAADAIVPLPLYVYCKACLEDFDLRVGPELQAKFNVLGKQFVEVSRLRQIFRAPNCEFAWVPIRADGSCVIVSTAMLLEVQVWDLCKALAAFALEWVALTENRNFFIPDPNEDKTIDKKTEFLEMWKSVARKKSEKTALRPIIDSWNSSGGDMMMKLIGDYLYSKCDRKQLRVYCLDEAHAEKAPQDPPRLRVAAAYPDCKCRGSVDVLRWNPILPHMDALRRKQLIG